MNKALKIALPILGTAAIAAGAALFAVAPGKADEEKKAPFMGRNIAHRGLHSMDKTVPENSMEAFRLAIEAGYGIELDVHLSRDGEVVVMHDDTLSRMCGVDRNIEDMRWSELRELKLLETEEHIPLLWDVLQMVDGRGPIVLEIKTGRRNSMLCRKVYRMLKAYKGDVCIESFHPAVVAWWRKNAPEYLRGQLACRPERYKDSANKLQGFVLGNLLLNFLGRPQFIAYGLCEKQPLMVRLCHKLGAMAVAWTSHDEKAEQTNDTVIFEFYRPRIWYK